MAGRWPVLLLTRTLGPGGTERQLTETARALDRSRFDPHVGCFYGEGMRADELRQAGVPVIEFPVRSFVNPTAVKGAMRMARYIRQHGIALVHAFDVPMNVWATPIGRALRVPVVLSSQRAYRDLTPGVWRHLLRLSDQIVDGVVVNCEAMRRHLIEEEQVAPGKVHRCYNGIDLTRFHAKGRRRMPPLEGAETVIGTVCGLRPEKGLESLVEAFSAVKTLRPGLRFVIVGSGPLLPDLVSRAQSLQLTDVLHFEPATSEVSPWLRSIDIFVQSSLSEALSNALMEAMACGCTAVASRVGGNVELAQEDVTGLTYPPGDAASLAAVLRLLVLDRDRSTRLAQSGTRFLHENFSLSASARCMEGLYTELLKNAAPLSLQSPQ